MKLNDSFPWMTFAILIIAIIVVIIGGIAVITNNLQFQTYLDDLEKFAVGVGLVGIGRGVLKNGIPTSTRR